MAARLRHFAQARSLYINVKISNTGGVLRRPDQKSNFRALERRCAISSQIEGRYFLANWCDKLACCRLKLKKRSPNSRPLDLLRAMVSTGCERCLFQLTSGQLSDETMENAAAKRILPASNSPAAGL